MSKKLNIPVNRVEGDLEITVELSGGVVKDAWCSGTMFRGIENILRGRHALDGLVITPRICGICSTTHLAAAAAALDMICGANVPDNARRVRNIALMTENIQSDMRHGFLFFAADFTNVAYSGHSLYEEAVRRYRPLKGCTALETIAETKRVLEIVAILGGQWPHSSFMVPGGVVTLPGASDILHCKNRLINYKEWYERRVLGCEIERWLEVKSKENLDAWLDESESHKEGETGFFVRFCREAGLSNIGAGHGNFLSYGSLDMPEETAVESGGGALFIKAGFSSGGEVREFDQEKVSEHVAHSWFQGYEGGRHPLSGLTIPHFDGKDADRYSWAKAPRYDGLPAETGPLAELIIAKDPLFTELVKKEGPSVFVRELARLTRPSRLIPAMEVWLDEIIKSGSSFYSQPGDVPDGDGFGLIEAARGALGHWVRIKDSRIEQYQVITPTAWHASPRDSNGRRGPFEESLVGIEVRDLENPVELGQVIRSYDACLVCTVHAIEASKGSRILSLRVG